MRVWLYNQTDVDSQLRIPNFTWLNATAREANFFFGFTASFEQFFGNCFTAPFKSFFRLSCAAVAELFANCCDEDSLLTSVKRYSYSTACFRVRVPSQAIEYEYESSSNQTPLFR